MGFRRMVTPLIVVVALLGGGSVAASCATSPSAQVTVDPNAGTLVSAIALGLFLRLLNPHFVPTCPYCLGIL